MRTKIIYLPVCDCSIRHLKGIVKILFQPSDFLLNVLHFLLAPGPWSDATKLSQQLFLFLEQEEPEHNKTKYILYLAAHKQMSK